MNRKCNCIGNKGVCAYDNICRQRIIVYEVKCKDTGKSYIGQTQQTFKDRMSGHFGDVQHLHDEGKKKSDSYAKHFAQQFPNGDNASPLEQRKHITSKVVWQGNPINAMKTFNPPPASSATENILKS